MGFQSLYQGQRRKTYYVAFPWINEPVPRIRILLGTVVLHDPPASFYKPHYCDATLLT